MFWPQRSHLKIFLRFVIFPLSFPFPRFPGRLAAFLMFIKNLYFPQSLFPSEGVLLEYSLWNREGEGWWSGLYKKMCGWWSKGWGRRRLGGKTRKKVKSGARCQVQSASLPWSLTTIISLDFFLSTLLHFFFQNQPHSLTAWLYHIPRITYFNQDLLKAWVFHLESKGPRAESA